MLKYLQACGLALTGKPLRLSISDNNDNCQGISVKIMWLCQSFPMHSSFVIHLKGKKRAKGSFSFSLAKSVLNTILQQ